MGHYAKMLHARLHRIYTVMSALRRALDRYIRNNIDIHERLTIGIYYITGWPCPRCMIARVAVIAVLVILLA